jgi:hypothetical protein
MNNRPCPTCSNSGSVPCDCEGRTCRLYGGRVRSHPCQDCAGFGTITASGQVRTAAERILPAGWTLGGDGR